MKHVNKTEWNEYLAETCTAERAAWINEHAKNCPDCQAMMQETLKVREMIGHWEVDTAGHTIVHKVAEAVRSDRISPKEAAKHAIGHRFRSNFFRIAAMVLLGIFLGHLAGRSSAKNHIAQQQSRVPEKTPSYLAALNFQFSSDLVHSVLEDNHTAPEDTK